MSLDCVIGTENWVEERMKEEEVGGGTGWGEKGALETGIGVTIMASSL